MRKLAEKFAADENGTSAIEYALVASLTSIAIFAMAGTLGLALLGRLDQVTQSLTEARR